MEIERIQQQDRVEVRISGRLDAHGADDLDRELAEVVRGGARLIRLDMAKIDYLSSAGIRILLKYWKELRKINGLFEVFSPSDTVRNILRISGMLELLEEKPGVVEGDELREQAPVALQREGGGRFALYHPAPETKLLLRLVGRPERLAGTGFTAQDVTELVLPRTTMAVGVGAFGADFHECSSRFGEFLAAGGATICLPTDGSGTPDDQVAVEAFVPTIQALYAAVCEGSFAHFFQFEPDESGGQSLPLTRLVDTAFSLCNASCVGLVLIAETDGLVGAHLRRPPVAEFASTPFAFPEVRNWLALTTERMYPRSLALVAGIAAKGDDPRLAAFIRPLGGETGLSGHIHAAAFSYRALPDGLLDLSTTVTNLLETQSLQGVLHLINDSRGISGIGESHFIRGALWAGPLAFNETPPAAPGGGAA